MSAKRLVLLGLGLLALVPVVFLVVLAVSAGDEQTDCSKVGDPAPGAWQEGDVEVRGRIVREFSLCERLQGRSQDEIERLLGPPAEVAAGELRYALPTGGAGALSTWVLLFDADGRVQDTRYDVISPEAR